MHIILISDQYQILYQQWNLVDMVDQQSDHLWSIIIIHLIDTRHIILIILMDIQWTHLLEDHLTDMRENHRLKKNLVMKNHLKK